jgi:putative membrane protein insertion efficiency factor
MQKLILFLLHLYRIAVSPLMAPRCRFYPTCSCYAQIAVARHGAAKGSYLAIRRLARCHPWHAGGVDLVPGLGQDELGHHG